MPLHKTKEAVRTTGQPLSLSRLLKWQTLKNYFFLCLFRRKRFLRLCVDILCLLCFFPFGIFNDYLVFTAATNDLDGLNAGMSCAGMVIVVCLVMLRAAF